MTAAVVAQTLALSEAAVAAFNGDGAEFAQHFGVAQDEGLWAVGQSAGKIPTPTAVVATVTGVTAVSVAFTAPQHPDEGSIVITSVPAITLSYDDQDFQSPVPVTGTFAAGTPYAFKVNILSQSGNNDSALSAASPQVVPNP